MKKVDPTKLTQAQERAWDNYVKAVKACKRTGIRFYQVLDTVSPLNGKVLDTIITDEPLEHRRFNPAQIVPLSYAVCYGSISVTCSFADDQHFAVLKDGYVNIDHEE